MHRDAQRGAEGRSKSTAIAQSRLSARLKFGTRHIPRLTAKARSFLRGFMAYDFSPHFWLIGQIKAYQGTGIPHIFPYFLGGALCL